MQGHGNADTTWTRHEVNSKNYIGHACTTCAADRNMTSQYKYSCFIADYAYLINHSYRVKTDFL